MTKQRLFDLFKKSTSFLGRFMLGEFVIALSLFLLGYYTFR